VFQTNTVARLIYKYLSARARLEPDVRDDYKESGIEGVAYGLTAEMK